MTEKHLPYLLLLMVIAVGCSSDKQSKGGLPYIDSRKEYPEKELILTDIADVTYVVLNSDNEEYLYSGSGIRCVTENSIIVYDTSSGSILFFSKDGNPKSRFNRMGRGPGEYLYPPGTMLYDEITDELFVVVFFPFSDFIYVYSSTGEFKRKISVPGVSISRIVSFDEHSLLVFDSNYLMWKRNDSPDPPMPGRNPQPLPFYSEAKYDSPFFLISKADGAILDMIKLPEKDFLLRDNEGERSGISTPLIHCPAGFFLCNPDADTVFLYNKDKSLTPVFYKTPPGSDSYPKVILNNCVDMGRYQFMELFTLKQEEGKLYRSYPVKYYYRDKNSGEIFQQKIVLPDYKGKDFNIRLYRYGNNFANGVHFILDVLELKQAYRANKLSGKLKELVATLRDDDNDVIMMVEFK